MADVTTNVTAVVSIIDKATPAVGGITKSLEQLDQVAKQVGTSMPANLDALLDRVAAGTRTLAEIQADMARSIEEQRRLTEAAGGLKPPPWAKIRPPDLPEVKLPEVKVPDVAPTITKQVEKAVADVEQPLASFTERARARIAEAFSLKEIAPALSRVGGLIKKHLGGALDYVSGLATKFGATFKSVFTGIAGFLAGYSLVGVFSKLDAIIDETTAKVTKLGDRAESIGVPVEQLQELQRWAEDSGLAAGTLDTNLKKLTQTLGQVAAGKNKDAAELFKKLNIELTDAATGAPRQAAEIIRDLATAFQNMPDASARAAAGLVFFGKNWEGIVAALRQGPEALDEAARMQQRIGEITGKNVEQIREYQKAQTRLADTFEAIRVSIGTALVPVLTPIVKNVQEWVLANEELLKQDIAAFVQGIGSALETVGPYLASTAKDFKTIQELISWVSDKLPGIKPPEPLYLEGMIPASFELPDPTKDWDPITKVREGIIAALNDMTDASNLWKGTLVEIQWIWDKIAKAIGFVADKWAAIKGGLTGAPWDPTLTRPPAIAAPTAVSAGGGPLTWETLGGPQPGGLITPAAGGQPPQGTVNVVIENKNPPPGTRTTAKAAGTGVTADVGQSMPWTAPAYGGPWAPAGA